MEFKSVLYEKKDKIVYLTMNRPEKMNAMNSELRKEMLYCWEKFADDNDAWIAIVSGAGDNFCSGGDISELTSDPTKQPLGGLHYGDVEIYKPIIAAVHGYCLGVGCSLALACDIRVCSEEAHFGYSHPRYGLESTGGPVRLPRWTFPGQAYYYLLTGEHIDAKEAYRLGLVAKVVPKPADVLPEATRIAQRIMENSPMAIRNTKEAFTRGFGLPLAQAFHISKRCEMANKKTEDFKEGQKAFGEKRKPVWKGR